MSTATSTVEQALEHLVREAMGTGAQVFVELARYGPLDLSASMLEVFGDHPASFLSIRTDLADAVLKPPVSAEDRDSLRTLLFDRSLSSLIDVRALADAIIAAGWHR